MDLNYLHTFVMVHEYGNISKAAEKLYLSQTTISNRIKELEKELGILLFERGGRHIRLTKEGECFLSYVKQSLSILDDAMHQMDKHSLPEGQIRLSSISNICTYVLPLWLSEFTAKFPRIEIKTDTDHSRPIVDKVLKANVDIGIVRGPITHNGLTSFPLSRDRVIPIVQAGHAWSGKRIAVEMLNEQNVIAYNRVSKTWKLIEQWLGEHNVKIRMQMDLDHDETGKQLVMNGHGVTFLPYFSVQQELEEGTLASFDLQPQMNVSMQTYLIIHRRHPLSPHAKKLFEFLLMMSVKEGRVPSES